jgi:hypothetical protein
MTVPFRGSESGLTKQQLRNRRFTRVTWDVYAFRDQALDLRARVAAAGVALPDGIPCRTTSALLQRLPVDDDGIVHLARGLEKARTRRDGIKVHRLALLPDELMVMRGITIAGGPRTLADLADQLELEALVALGDVVLRRWGRAAVEQAVERSARRPGVRALREAAALLDAGADSPAETRARLRLHAAGFTGLQHKVVVRDSGGGWLGVPDLADEEAKVALQHEGAVHFEKGVKQRRSDVDRDEVVRQENWQVVTSTALDDARPERLLRKVTAAYLRSAVLHGSHLLPAHLRAPAPAPPRSGWQEDPRHR